MASPAPAPCASPASSSLSSLLSSSEDDPVCDPDELAVLPSSSSSELDESFEESSCSGFGAGKRGSGAAAERKATKGRSAGR
jgi:hypothetical protein